MKPKVLVITSQYPPQVGGVARAAARNISFLSPLYSVTILNITHDQETGQVVQVCQEDLVIYRIGAAKSVAETLRLTATFIEDLHANQQFSLFIGFYLVYAGYLAVYHGRLFNCPSFVSIRGNDLDMALFTPDHFPFVEWTLRHATLVGCVTRALATQAETLSGRKDILYMPNSVDSELWQPLAPDKILQAELGIKDHLVLGFVGELRVKKSPQALLAAFAALSQHRPTKLLLIGGVRDAEARLITNFTTQHPQLAENIHLVNYIADREQLRRYYSILDIALFISLWEGMSNALLEAMSMAKLVVATPVGGNSELITHQQQGFLLPRYQLQELGSLLITIDQLARSEWELIAQRARQRIQADFSLVSERERLLKTVATLLNR